MVASKNAKVTTSVDLANRSRTLTEENFGLNGVDPKVNISMSWIHLIFIIMQHVMENNMTQ